MLALLEETYFLYSNAFGFVSADANIERLRSIEFNENVVRLKLKSNLHLWLNFLVLKSVAIGTQDGVINKNGDIRQQFSNAFKSLTDKDGLEILWAE